MEKAYHIITEVEKGSLAETAGIKPGEKLLALSGKPVGDVIDYMYLSSEPVISVTVIDTSGSQRTVNINNPDYRPLGMIFENYLMDSEQHCKNKCIFCFIDQLPKGLRKPLYFKDDDVRLSFLTGNYVTLTNLSDHAVNKIIDMGLSPVNISVHTMDPSLRAFMMKNPKAAEIGDILHRFADRGISMRCQIVLCPGINDKGHLDFTMEKLKELWPSITSVSVVPVGLTRFRKNCFPLPFPDTAFAKRTLTQINRMADNCLKTLNTRLFYAADEFYLLAKMPLPRLAHYEEMEQLENGIGMLSLFSAQAKKAISWAKNPKTSFKCTIATGEAAAPFISGIVDMLKIKCNNIHCEVLAVKNNFFGGNVNIAGLVTGSDLVSALKEKAIQGTVFIPLSMLRSDGDLFLDGMTPKDISESLGVDIVPLQTDGEVLIKALCGTYKTI